MLLVRYAGRALRRAMAMGLLAAIRGRRVLIPIAGLLVLGYAALTFAGRGPLAPVAAVQERPSAAAATTRLAGSTAAAVPSVDSYIRGLTQFDARLMWGSLSE